MSTSSLPSPVSRDPAEDGRRTEGRRATFRRPFRPPIRWAGARAGSVLVVALGLLVLAGVGYAGSRASATPPPPRETPARFPVTVEIYSVGGIDSVVPATLHLPVGALVSFTIYNFDPTAVGAPPANAAIQGVFVGPVTLTGSGAPDGPSAGLAPSLVSHTFTTGSGPYDFNVPIPAAEGPAVPALATFNLYFNVSGDFHWYCAAFCDDGGLGGPGEMGGVIVVAPD